jgi:hypothetical protein
MVKIDMYDDENYLLFTEGYLPEMDCLQRAIPNAPQPFRGYQPDFACRDEAAAWVLTAMARRLISSRGQGNWNEQAAMNLPLETWVIGPTHEATGALAYWFDPEPANTSYRLLIHRSPRRYEDREFASPWRTMHWYLKCRGRAGNPVPIRHRTGRSVDLKQRMKPFLRDVLAAYQTGNEAVKRVIERARHPYWRSFGIPSPSPKR